MNTEEELLKLLQEHEGSPLEARILEVLQMPPEEQAAAMASLTKAYDPMRDDLRAEVERNYDTLASAGPQGQVAGDNPYSIYVGANPLEHLASGYNKFQAGKDIGGQRKELKALNKEQSEATAAIQMAQAKALRRKQEEERMRRLSQMGP